MMFCVGLTGNIATGKSTVAQEFKALGAEIISADDLSRELCQKGKPAYDKIVQHFGQTILDNDGQIQRKNLRHLIFGHPEEKIWLENLLHPMIRKEIEAGIENSCATYVLVEIPLHFKRDAYPYLSRVLLVTAPESVQIMRIMDRDHCSEEQALAMIKHQPNLEVRQTIADDILVNDGNMLKLKQRVMELNSAYQKFH